MSEQIEVSSLSEHPLLARVGRSWELAETEALRAKNGGDDAAKHAAKAEELKEEFAGLVESVRRFGVMEPLKVAKSGPLVQVVDGRHRLAAAKEAGREKVPVTFVTQAEAPAIIQTALANRRHVSKGSLAFLAVLLNPDLAEGARERQLAGKPSAQNAEGQDGEPSAQNAEAICKSFGVSSRLLEQALQLHRLLGDDKVSARARRHAEAAVWSGYGLGGIIAGLRSQIETGGSLPKRDPAAEGWTKFIRGIDSLRNGLSGWEAMNDEQRETAKERFRDAVATLPDELKKELHS